MLFHSTIGPDLNLDQFSDMLDKAKVSGHHGSDGIRCPIAATT